MRKFSCKCYDICGGHIVDFGDKVDFWIEYRFNDDDIGLENRNSVGTMEFNHCPSCGREITESD